MDNFKSNSGGLHELSLFTGCGGGLLASHLLGWRTVCAVEYEQYPASVLAQRQNDKLLPPFPIWDNVRTFDGNPWRGIVDVVSGGFPCQDISPARTNGGNKGKGLDGSKSGLWSEFARIIGEVEPEWVLVENSHHLRTKGLGRVLKDLACLGYNAAWGVLSAKDCGANHERKRMWIVAHTNVPQRQRRWIPSGGNQEHADSRVGAWWKNQSSIHRVDDGVAYRMDRLKAVGNGQVPIVAATAFNQLANVLAKYSSQRSAS